MVCLMWKLTWWKHGSRMLAMIHNPDCQWLMTDRCPIFGCTFHRTKTLAAVSKGANLSLAAVPFSKGTSTPYVSWKVINLFACWLCVTCVHLSQSPLFSVAGVCLFFGNFLAPLMVDIQTPYSVQESMHNVQTVQIFVLTKNKASTSVQHRGGVLSGCASQFLGHWSAVKLQRYYPSISCQSWGYSQGPQKTCHW
jgi:hypothetical protein